jgi:hypothetical protein
MILSRPALTPEQARHRCESLVDKLRWAIRPDGTRDQQMIEVIVRVEGWAWILREPVALERFITKATALNGKATVPTGYAPPAS